jgi:alpha,alpha-trehalase
MVAIEGVVYAGSHGFDVAGPGASHRGQERWDRFLPSLDHAEKDLLRSLANIPGSRVERKRFAIAVHHRAMDDAYLEELEERVEQVAARQPELRKSTGKKIFELRPDIDWDKGTALLSLLEALDNDTGEVVPLFIGDDVTDEDAFRAIRERGIGIVVGDDERQSAAHYALRDPGEVRVFLETLIALPGGRPQ